LGLYRINTQEPPQHRIVIPLNKATRRGLRRWMRFDPDALRPAGAIVPDTRSAPPSKSP
jgi:hypothetical protein